MASNPHKINRVLVAVKKNVMIQFIMTVMIAYGFLGLVYIVGHIWLADHPICPFTWSDFKWNRDGKILIPVLISGIVAIVVGFLWLSINCY